MILQRVPHKKVTCTILYVLLFLHHCIMINNIENGGTTEITNARLEGYIYIADPDTVGAANTAVYLHPLNESSRVCYTDVSGAFYFDSVPCGSRYWIESKVDEIYGTLKMIRISKGETLITVNSCMQRLGGIKGTIIADSATGNLKDIYKTTTIVIPEVKSHFYVDTNGLYGNYTLAPYNGYTVIIDNVSYPSINDTFIIGVEEGKISHLNNNNSSPYFLHGSEALCNSAVLGIEYCDTVHAVDPDGDPLSFSLAKGPIDMQLIDSIIVWTPLTAGGCCKKKDISVTLHVLDNKGGYAAINWKIHIYTNMKKRKNSSILLRIDK